MRGHAGEVEHVVVLATLGAVPRAGRVRGRRARPVAPEPPPEPVTTGRATVVRSVPLEDAAGWLARADLEAEADRGVAVLNRVLHGHRVATADPWAAEASLEQAIAVRVGVGAGDRLVAGRWDDAVLLPRRAPPRRSAALRPQERLAALLGGRDAALACEELVLRARADLTGGRSREAALQADVALRTAVAELVAWRDRADLPARLDELAALAPGIAGAAASALAGGVSVAELAAVEHAVARLEAALRARSASGF